MTTRSTRLKMKKTPRKCTRMAPKEGAPSRAINLIADQVVTATTVSRKRPATTQRSRRSAALSGGASLRTGSGASPIQRRGLYARDPRMTMLTAMDSTVPSTSTEVQKAVTFLAPMPRDPRSVEQRRLNYMACKMLPLRAPCRTATIASHSH